MYLVLTRGSNFLGHCTAGVCHVVCVCVCGGGIGSYLSLWALVFGTVTV
jgi:hypothetical protein